MSLNKVGLSRPYIPNTYNAAQMFSLYFKTCHAFADLLNAGTISVRVQSSSSQCSAFGKTRCGMFIRTF